MARFASVITAGIVLSALVSAVGGCSAGHVEKLKPGWIRLEDGRVGFYCAFESDFSKAEVGTQSTGYVASLTGSGGKSAWVVREDEAILPSRAVVQETAEPRLDRFPLLLEPEFFGEDTSIQAQFKCVSGRVDQAGGVVVRYTPGNYYVAAVSVSEGKVKLCRVVRGRLETLVERPAIVAVGTWHTIKLSVMDRRLVVNLDDKQVIECEDHAISGTGQVGLWTHADAVTAFSHLEGAHCGKPVE